MLRRVAILSAVLLGGCQCGFDTGKLDDLACGSDADCAPGQRCLDGTCSRRDCEVPDDCGDGFLFECDGGRCAPVGCEDDEDCPRGFGCVEGLCTAGAGPCERHADCDDGVYCDGAERCNEGRCEAGPPPDCELELGECEVAVCIEETGTCRVEPAPDGAPCEDGDPCTGPDTCTDLVCGSGGDACDDDLPCTPGQCIPDEGCVVDAGACAIDDACWAGGDPHPSDPCLACDPAADPRAWSAGPPARCDDGDDCTSGDSCDEGVCAGAPFTCADGLACTDDLCDGAGGCLFEPAFGTCLIAGVCAAEGEANPQNGCEACDPDTSATAWTADDARVPADDGIACTTGACVSGHAVHTADDALCGNDQVCAVCAGGCMAPPTLTVDCGAGASTPGGAARTCTVTGSADAACLSCSSVVGMTSLVRNDLDVCEDLNALGWDPTGSEPRCDGDHRLEYEDIGWSRAARTVDTRDFDSVRMCFRFLDVGMGNDDSLTIELNTAGVWADVWSHQGGPFPEGEFVGTTFCVDLDEADPAAADNQSLQVRLVVDADLSFAALDDIAIDAWDSSTLAFPGPVAQSDFTGCDLDGWLDGGDPVVCPGADAPHVGEDLVEVNDALSELSRTVDLSDRCDDIRVGFSAAAEGGFWPRDFTSLFVDHGAGEQEVTALGASRPDALLPLEYVLSHADPDVRFQSSVTFRFQIEAGAAGATQWIDDVWVDGATCGSGDGIVTIGAPVAGGGGATVAVSSAVQTTAYLSCAWDGRVSTQTRAPIVFRY